jgi:hypothetical protein
MVTLAPNRSERRATRSARGRAERAAATEAHHDTLVRGVPLDAASAAGNAARTSRPTILQRTEQNFLPAVLEDLAKFMTGGRARLAASLATTRTTRGVLKLFQPVQRTFHIALVDLACDRIGAPRLDPARVESGGLVLRRVWRDQNRVANPTILEGWRQDGARVAGWIRFASAAEADLDPDPERRRGPSGHAQLDERLALSQNAVRKYAERTAPMFVAPPAACEAAGRTVVYGVIQTASTERVEPPPNATAPREQFPVADVRNRLSPFLRAVSGGYIVPNAGFKVRVKAGDTTDLEAQDQRHATTAAEAGVRQWNTVNEDSASFRTYTDMLRQVALEYDAFGQSAQARAFYAELNRILLPIRPAGRPTWHAEDMRRAGELLRQQHEVLVRHDRAPQRIPGESWPEWPAVQMPQNWPAVSATVTTALVSAAKNVLDKRLAQVPQGSGRFDDRDAQYRIRVFVRLRSEEGCPPKIVWSDYSEPFTIAPWYESGGVPPVPIPLPDPTRDFLASLKPNVSFVVPGPLADFLNKNDPKKIMLGQGSAGSAQLGFVCGFSIPIITICAFILLSIVLGILDIFLRWLPFVKICVPLPSVSLSPPSESQ